MEQSTTSVYEDIKNTIQDKLGYNIISNSQVNRGWLNLKWKINTDYGTKVIKQYNPSRNPPHKIKQIEKALQRQSVLHEKGVKCPKMHWFEDSPIIKSYNGENFCVLDFYEGDIVKPNNINSDQMYDLGKDIALFHKVSNESFGVNAVVEWRPSFEYMTENWHKVWEKANRDNLHELLILLQKQKSIIESIDFSYFNNCRLNWVHADLWVDNILFTSNNLSCIVDFDRNCYAFAELDIGRVLLSLALNDDNLNIDIASAFLKGYQELYPLKDTDIIRALKLTWCLETFWWINSGMYAHKDSSPVQKFVSEMIWLTNNWTTLNELLGIPD